MEKVRGIESKEIPKDKIIFIPGTTFMDRIYALGKSKIQDEIFNGNVKNKRQEKK